MTKVYLFTKNLEQKANSNEKNNLDRLDQMKFELIEISDDMPNVGQDLEDIKIKLLKYLSKTIFEDKEFEFAISHLDLALVETEEKSYDAIIGIVNDRNIAIIEDVNEQMFLPILTNRENLILSLLSKGYFYKEIASNLSLSINTVKQHVNHIYKKLQVQNRMEAVNKSKYYI